jgi:aconitate decarboxylase
VTLRGVFRYHMGLAAAGETCITASTRNFRGRMGSPDASIFMAPAPFDGSLTGRQKTAGNKMSTDSKAASAPTDPAGPTGRLATWLADVSGDDVPDRVRERACYALLDGVGCGLVGAQLPWSRTAVTALTSVEDPGRHTLIGWDKKVSSQAAAVLNSTFIQGFELDDYHPRAPLHSASLLIPALLATAEDLGDIGGADFLTAAVLGYEVGPRVGMGLHGGQMLSRGWHSGAVFGTHAAAAAAGHLRELSAAQFEDALGLAGTQSGGLMAAQYEAMSKRMHHGFASRAGYHAALFAAHGYTGIKRVFEREYGGWLATFGEGHDPDPSQVHLALGDEWMTESVAFKAFAAMAGLHAAIDGTLQERKAGLKAADVTGIHVTVSHAVYHHGWWRPDRPLTTIGAQMNIGYAIAAALVDGQVLVEQFTPAKLDDDEIWRLIDCTQVEMDDTYQTAAGPGRYTTDLVFETKNGERRRRVLTPPGGVGRPLSNQDLLDKYRALTDGIVTPARRGEIERLVLGLDEGRPLSDLLSVLGGEVGAVL